MVVEGSSGKKGAPCPSLPIHPSAALCWWRPLVPTGAALALAGVRPTGYPSGPALRPAWRAPALTRGVGRASSASAWVAVTTWGALCAPGPSGGRCLQSLPQQPGDAHTAIST